MSKVFNSSFEISLRILLLLDSAGTSRSLTDIVLTDFIATYGREFGISDHNLNGNNLLMYSELASRREIIQLALKELVLTACVFPVQTEAGFLFKITELGQKSIRSMFGMYATEYRSALSAAFRLTERCSTSEVEKMIYDQSLASLQGRR